MNYKFTVTKTKLYKLLRDKWPGWYPLPEFRICEYRHLGSKAFWLQSWDGDLEVYLSTCAGCDLLAIESQQFGRVVVHLSVDELLERFMLNAVA